MPIRLSVLHPLMHDCDTSPTGYTSALYAAAPRAHSIYWVFVGLVGRSPLARQLGAFFGFCFFFAFLIFVFCPQIAVLFGGGGKNSPKRQGSGTVSAGSGDTPQSVAPRAQSPD